MARHFHRLRRLVRRLAVFTYTAVALAVGGYFLRPAGTPPWADGTAVSVGLLGAFGLAVFLVPLRDHARFFTLAQRDLAGVAFGANCIWRPTHWPPALAAYLLSGEAWQHHRPALWTASLALTLLAGIGLPITREAGRCGGTIQGGHQWPDAHGGTTSIWNCEPSCRICNGAQSDTWSWWWAFTQWPWTLPVYAIRNVRGTCRLAWILHRAADCAKDAPAPASTASNWSQDDTAAA